MKDAEVTRFMSMAPEASSITQPFPMLVELSAGMEYVDCKIRKALAQGSAVLVHGWKPHQAMKFSTEDVETYRLPIHQTVTWQGELYRARHTFSSPSKPFQTLICVPPSFPRTHPNGTTLHSFALVPWLTLWLRQTMKTPV
jgi:hypothetical protein